MKNIAFLICFTGILLFNCNKKEVIDPMANNNTCCDNNSPKDSTYIQVENAYGVDKVFRLYGGSTGLDPVTDNSALALSTGTGFDNSVTSIDTNSLGNFIIGGFFSSYNGFSTSHVVNLSPDGSYYSGFNTGAGFAGGFPVVRKVAVQSDDKVIAVGSGFTSYQGNSCTNIVRINTDGSFDNTFITGSGFNGVVNNAVIQSDGKIILGGLFSSYNGVGANGIVRINTDGSIDNTFVYGTGFSLGLGLTALSIQSDNKILVGTTAPDYNGSSINGLVRINTDGSIDNTFNTSFVSPGIIRCIVVQSNGKIFVSKAGPVESIVRLNTDGSDDGSFNGELLAGAVVCAYIQSDGKIIIGGNFTSYGGVATNRVIRLNSDGSIDSTFVYGTGFDATVRGIVVESGDDIVVSVGDFTTYDGESHNYITGTSSTGSTTVIPVDIIVNGGESTVESINADTGPNPICICEIQIDTDNKEAYKNLFYKKEKNSTGEVNSASIPLLSKYTAAQANGVNTIVIDGKEFATCVLDGTNYLEWTVPANSSVTLNVKYCQYDRSANLGSVPLRKVKKKYVHGAFKYYIN